MDRCQPYGFSLKRSCNSIRASIFIESRYLSYIFQNKNGALRPRAEAPGFGPSPTIPASLSFNLAGKSPRTPGVQHTCGLSEFSLFSASAVQISSVFLPPLIFLSTFHTAWRMVMHPQSFSDIHMLSNPEYQQGVQLMRLIDHPQIIFLDTVSLTNTLPPVLCAH
jgi:hypothetical protein